MEDRQKNSFEYNVLVVACIIGLLRSVIEVASDLMAVELLPNFYLDLTFIFVFTLTLIVLKKKASFQTVLFVFYIPFITIITIMFYDGRGLAYSIENNVFASLIIITFTTRDRIPLYLNGALFVAIVLSLMVIENQHQFLQSFTSLNSSRFNFLFSSVGIIAFTLYAKSEFEKRKKKIAIANEQLDQNNQSLQKKNGELLAQKEALESLTISLDEKIKNDSKRLQTQKKTEEKYLSITLTELFDAYQETIDTVEKFSNESDHIATMVLKSGENLKVEMEALRNKIEESISEVD